ncbi:hypothetical protein LWI29_010757 [Acer saccharum]|uniref:Cytochrome P450 n=1 Tax=Acer saccharum TaxID=4024 RepID=A0AA39VXC6_ACESA|nr:hypothetical protein LWI29_010757 [Acer saccharum]
METSLGVWLAWVVGVVPILGLLLWCWNELWYAVPLKFRYSGTGTRLPPGHMGFPIFGETLAFLWYFKVLRRPDEFINSKRRKYGDGVGMYRTHLLGSPSVIVCFPSISKIVYQSDEIFRLQWPAVDLVGRTSLVSVHGKAHERLRSFVTKAINRPDALRRIAALVQPSMVAALQSWAQKRNVKVSYEAKKVTFENIGKLFVSFESGPRLESMEKLFQGLLKGIRAHPFNFPGTAYHHASQCRKKLEAIFRVELEKKKNRTGIDQTTNIDLMDGLMQVEDDIGKRLSDQEVIDNIVTLVVAGYSSTALTSTWALYFLAKHPNVLEKLRVVEETIRMTNIAGFTFRLAIKEAEYKEPGLGLSISLMPETRSGQSYNSMEQASHNPNLSNPSVNPNPPPPNIQQQLDQLSQTLGTIMHRLDIIEEHSTARRGRDFGMEHRAPHRREGIGDSDDEREIQLGEGR